MEQQHPQYDYSSAPQGNNPFQPQYNEIQPGGMAPGSNEKDDPFKPCGPEGKQRGIAALLAIFLGGFGGQYFYLGKYVAAWTSLIVSIAAYIVFTIFLFFITLITFGLGVMFWPLIVVCGIPSLIGVIQGICMFCMTNEKFREKYILTSSSFPLF